MGECAAAHRARVDALAARLDAPDAASQRDTLRAELIALGKALEQDLAELTAVRDDAKALVERWKGLQASAAPEFSADRPVVADHIGASTFIEKGWSRISLGDYAGAEESLLRALQLAPDDPQAVSLLGCAQMLQEKYDDGVMKRAVGEADEDAWRVIRVNSDRKAALYAHFCDGPVYVERDMFEDAHTGGQETSGLGPNLGGAHFELGRRYWFHGQHEQAR